MTMTVNATGRHGAIAVRTNERVFVVDGETYVTVRSFDVADGESHLIGEVTYWRNWSGEWDMLSPAEGAVIREAYAVDA